MYKGERRVITVEISSRDQESFVIRNPEYRLKYGNTVEDEGVPVLAGHDLTVIVEPEYAGRYVLECIMEIASEKIIRKLPIFVRD